MSDTNTYNWTISALEAYTTQSGYTDVVYTIHWRYGAKQVSGSYSSEMYGAESVAPFNPESSSFIPFEDLTKDIVIGWLTGSLGEEKVNAMTSSLDAQIEEQITPRTVTLGVPWTDPTPTPVPVPTMPPGPYPTMSYAPTPTPI